MFETQAFLQRRAPPSKFVYIGAYRKFLAKNGCLKIVTLGKVASAPSLNPPLPTVIRTRCLRVRQQFSVKKEKMSKKIF